MTDILAVELRIRRDAVFMKTENGILFRGRQGAFALRGATVYNTFRELLPYLDGKTKAADLLHAFAADRRQSIGNLLQALVQRGIVHPTPSEEHTTLTAPVAEAFDPQIEFIRHYADLPVERFARFRETRILLTGSGTAYASAGAALLRNGLRQLHVLPGADHELLRLQTRRLNEQNLPCSVEEAVADVDWVLYCSETPSLAEIFRHNRAAVAGKYRFLPAFAYAGSLFVGPYVDQESGPCWQCAMLRWSDNADPPAARELWRSIALELPAGRSEASEVSAHMLGNTAALEVFKFCAGQPAGETRAQMLKQDLNTLESGIRTILPHPQCGLCRAPRSAIGSVPDSAPVLSRWAEYQDHEFGILPPFDDEHIEQIPLRISTLRYGKQRAIGWSVEDSAGARLHAMKKALAAISSDEPGIGIGVTLEEARQEALLSLAVYRTVAGLAHESLGVQRWNLEQASADRTTAYLLATAGHMALGSPSLWLAAPLPGICAAFLSPSGESASPARELLIGTSFSATAAANSVLSEWIARAQLQQGGLDWDDAPRPDGPYGSDFLEWTERDAVATPEPAVSFIDITFADIAATRTFRVVRAVLS